uniref:carnosine N-methyltransferase n=1 Tax=Chromera velia CCMP2878 TaxID=1169474 RepID=A0A0G4HL64_9ALVE|mmetsp:Transcript_32996/g.65350  ORF Transcript_32996/g.65350 Transcript_32996/m.65350 type:complete len:655 (-) Transcript_32996:422-2386(-)|eukprot:Cvel_28859.t1-p1 / transcript=Cvel_28859.t1 / gene=Cvel_28859 / organism=Chromera_velia_CCMP2878 / gene_product=UPF0586 protein C9orf41, putative / transcript_product=UPF0586 protein C9orf41, putative / location=Cvel_scaffold3853:1981-7959(+) / protein_length=654 / sequence_SO=supercontig / SO=protein_coding / is_pseudo=false
MSNLEDLPSESMDDEDSQEEDAEDAETRHFMSVCYALANYQLDCAPEVARMDRYFHLLSDDDRALLTEDIDSRIDQIRGSIALNQQFLDFLLMPHKDELLHHAYSKAYLMAERVKQQAAAAEAASASAAVVAPALASGEGGPNSKGPGASPETAARIFASLPPSMQALLGPPGDSPPLFPPPQPASTEGPTAETDSHSQSARGPSGPSGSPSGRSKTSEGPGDGAAADEERACCRCKPCQRMNLPVPERLAQFSWPQALDLFRDSTSHPTASRNISKVRSTLRQFVRDWSTEGEQERRECYQPLLDALEEYLPVSCRRPDGNAPKVLCPGSGLGRLPYEVMKRGYSCQGNEFSYFMLFGSNFILNFSVQREALVLMPYCLASNNRLGHEDHLREIRVPDEAPAETIRPEVVAANRQEFSMCAGEFVEVYTAPNQLKDWDGILTCFFIDTAKNVITYVRAIAGLLRTGGLWANLGPLLYHFAEMSNEFSIELSWEELKPIIAKYFDFQKVEMRDAYYSSNARSMMRVKYHCVYFVAIRNDVPVTGASNPTNASAVRRAHMEMESAAHAHAHAHAHTHDGEVCTSHSHGGHGHGGPGPGMSPPGGMQGHRHSHDGQGPADTPLARGGPEKEAGGANTDGGASKKEEDGANVTMGGA